MTADQRRRLVDAFLQAFPTENDLQDLIFFADFNPPKTLQSITTATGLKAQVRELITKAEAEGWLPKLVDEAAKANAANHALAELRDEIKPLILAALANPYKTCFMGNRPLVDREGLRTAMERLTNRLCRIVIIDGPEQSGKSYTIWFIRYLRDHQGGGFGLVWIDLRELAGSNAALIQPQVLARSMVAQMGLPPSTVPVKEEETYAAWTQEFCNKLTGALAVAASPWWVVFDNFHQVLLPLETLELIKELAKRTAINIPTLHMVLLSYRDSLPDDVEPDVERETIGAIGPTELALFFKELYESRQLPATPSEVAGHVKDVLEAVDPNHPQRLRKLEIEVRRVAGKVVGE